MKIFTLFKPGSPGILMAAIIAFMSVMPLSSIAQADDPNRDQIPSSYWNRVIPPSNPANPASSIITVNNWDNFNLGVDFGESNMAASMSTPKWYFTAYNTNAAHHTENGLDWANVTPNFGTSMAGDPVVAYDSLGNLFYQNMFGNISGTKVIRSTDNGATWSSAVTATVGVDKNWMACDQTSGPYANYIYACMTANAGGYFSRSIDHGATWQNTFNPSTQTIPGMMVCVGANGNVQGGSVYVVTNSGQSYASTYTFYRSTDGGQTFTQMSAQNFSGYVGTYVGGRNSVQNMRTRPYPMIAADNSYGAHRGRFYLVYASNDPPGSGNKSDVWSRYSDDGGTTWSPALRVNDDANPQAHQQWHPAIWCDKETGRLYAMWMDTRDIPTSDSAYIYASFSDDGGASWITNQRISNQKMKIDCGSCGGGGTPRYQGDYNGIVSNKKVAMAGWVDYRQGSFMSVTAYIPDFAMAVDKSLDTLYLPNDSAIVNVSIPEVKLYSDTVVLSASVNPVPAGGNITFSFPSGNQITTVPGGSKPVKIKLTGNVPLGNYQAWIEAAGTNGTPAHRRVVTLKVLTSDNVNVLTSASPASFCTGGSSQLNAQVNGGTAPYTYSWTPVTGLNNPAIANPVATPTTSTMYKCTVTDNAAKVGKDSVLVTVETVPATPGAISGASSVCSGTNTSHSIANVPFATNYTWSVPAGSSITAGQGTITVTVAWGPVAGDLSVIASNACGTSAASIKAMNVTHTPAAPANISGPSSVCKNGVETFIADTVVGATSYYWTFPSDVLINSGQNTNTVNVTWGQASGNITVDAQNLCGTSPETNKPVVVLGSPMAAGNISGKDTVCMGKGGYVYSVGLISGATSYTWTLPVGATITTGDGTQTITVAFASNAVSGDVTVAGTNSCGPGPSSSKTVKVNNCTGIAENQPNPLAKVFPNPTSGKLNLSFNETLRQVEVVVVNADGQVVGRQTFENISAGNNRQIDMTRLPGGIYYVKVISESRTQVEKVAKD